MSAKNARTFAASEPPASSNSGGTAAMVSLLTLSMVCMVGIVYFYNRFKAAQRKAEDDRASFVHVFVPFLMMSGLALWLLFFKNPFVSARISFRDDDTLSSYLLPSGSQGKSSMSKKMLYGFILSLASYMAYVAKSSDFSA